MSTFNQRILIIKYIHNPLLNILEKLHAHMFEHFYLFIISINIYWTSWWRSCCNKFIKSMCKCIGYINTFRWISINRKRYQSSHLIIMITSMKSNWWWCIKNERERKRRTWYLFLYRLYLDGRAIFFFFFSFHSIVHLAEREQFYRPKINLYWITSTFVHQTMNGHFQYHKSKKVSHV